MLTLIALPGIPEVRPGDRLAALIVAALDRAAARLEPDDVLIVAQKIISKAEGRFARLSDVTPSARAREVGRAVGRDPRLVELVLRESRGVLRVKPGVLIAEHRLGFVMANAGVDQSNVPHAETAETALMLPEDPDASARRLQEELHEACGVEAGIVINDSFGRAWRNGVTGVAIGVAGVPALVDLRGSADREGRPLRVTQVAAADELAAAGSLLMGQADEGCPVVLARGFPYAGRESSTRELIRPETEDLFR
ncbi:MAG: coenzyme F420-0:L-glutamate ligase [Betaproteobacteria bacterium]|nr:coenzyme F420-0:L-glutamate ligase [Betaproteobacteria bacterium]MDH3437986.1 coenzyme F420-0:L-glutamate ligase [Betaproteobacteria bacterium]